MLDGIASRLGCEVVFDSFEGSALDHFLAPGNTAHGDRSFDPLEVIRRVVRNARAQGIDGLTSGIGYPGMCLASAAAEELGLPGPPVAAVLGCEHKYYSRLAQKRLVPEAVPPFELVDLGRPAPPPLAFPFFIKPVKSCFSIGARVVHGPESFRRLLDTCPIPEGYVRPLDRMVRAYTDFDRPATGLLAEGLLRGHQVSIDGFVHRGEARVLGIVDGIMFPGHPLVFERFQYPSSLPREVQERMAEIALRFITGIGYVDALFNVEMIYNPETGDVHILEINPKLAAQMVDLYEKVDGTSSFEIMLSLALGREPRFEPGRGPFEVSASFPLRVFEDRRVVAVPDEPQLERLREIFPDAWVGIDVRPGQKLSDVMQDGMSYRYAVVNLGAESAAALEEKLAACRGLLDFRFEAV